MKTVLLLLLVSSVYAACPEGTISHEGVCAADPSPAKAPEVNYASDEKPRKSQQPEWETGEVKAEMPPSLISDDQKMDLQKYDAIQTGKKAAGLN
jgi:hypothetical protein